MESCYSHVPLPLLWNIFQDYNFPENGSYSYLHFSLSSSYFKQPKPLLQKQKKKGNYSRFTITIVVLTICNELAELITFNEAGIHTSNTCTLLIRNPHGNFIACEKFVKPCLVALLKIALYDYWQDRSLIIEGPVRILKCGPKFIYSYFLNILLYVFIKISGDALDCIL
ncbi:uncharacterized protein M6B38_184925 [Iris pallida]|uniref:Uncharacterized protein n=1 Tax=Iris pallida TaxID=29817 RepID=A0AAX6EL85_IRIPA|nr:uncharacterized protein M6B38_184925 [Iris pallida]